MRPGSPRSTLLHRCLKRQAVAPDRLVVRAASDERDVEAGLMKPRADGTAHRASQHPNRVNAPVTFVATSS